jgi:uncharacterized cupredoxin-like copper-binding protein
MTRISRAALLAIGLLIVGLVLSPRWGGAGAAPRIVKVKAFEFAYDPKQITVPPGSVEFDVTNTGSIEHTFLIDDPAKKTVGKIASILPGKTTKLTVTLKAGVHTIYCDLAGHREAGMLAALKVQP